jgi:hypothetical protein
MAARQRDRREGRVTPSKKDDECDDQTRKGGNWTMRMEVRLVFGHTRFPSADELALGDGLHLAVYRKAKPLISQGAQGTSHGSVYSQ